MLSILMRVSCLLLLVLALAPGVVRAEEDVAVPPPSEETLLLQQPTVSKDHVAFVYAQDIWVVGREGGVARRLTSHVGDEVAPFFSPDGKHIAFTASYEGNTDVYVLPVEGGTPKRLTWHPGSDVTRGWHPDGQRILFASRRESGPPVYRLFHVALEGGMPEALPIPRAFRASWKGDGSRLAYTPIVDPFQSWKRHRGGQAPPVWIYDPKTHEVTEVPHGRASDTFPVWVDGWLYFASDRDGQMNLYKHRRGQEPEQITRFKDFGIRRMTSGAGVIAYSRAGAIHIYDPKTNTHKRMAIRCPTDGGHRNPSWVSVGGAARNAAISPDGKRVAFEARGEIITMPREHGAPRNISNTPGAHDRDPVWDPKGGRIAWFSDASGEYQLRVVDAKGREAPRDIDLGGAGFYHDPVWSPDGKHIIFSDKANRLAYVTVESGKVTVISQTQGSLGVWQPFGVWSPDSQWIAFEHKNAVTAFNGVSLFEVATGKVTPLTDAFSHADSPAFSADGKHLFFQASVNSGPRSFGLDMSASTVRDPSARLYVAVLRKDLPHPMGPRSDEAAVEKPKPAKKKEEPKKEGEEKKDEEKDKDQKEEKKEEKKPSVDVEDIDQRILALPLGSGRYWGLVCVKGKLLFLERSGSGWVFALKAFDFKSRKAKGLGSGVTALEVAAGGKHLLVKFGSAWAITDTNGGARKNLNIRGVRVRVDPTKEWPQILRETWRIQRDYFYDPQMHQVDWKAMWERWSAFLPHVQHRDELSLLQMEMMGELCCGHEYVSGGAAPSAGRAIGVGLLGADFEVHEGHYRLARIYKGQNWNAGLRAPLTEPGVNAEVGDYILRVNGHELDASRNLFEAFEGTAGQPVEIVLAKSPTPDPEDKKATRTVTVTPVSSEGTLRRLEWIETNRRRVEELSDGKLAYIYMPNTGGAGLAAFDRDYYSQLDKQGVVLDERFNGGGKVADYVIQVLGRKVLAYWMNREGWLGRTPFGTIRGPKVMLINERAGSGGDAMPWMFRKMKLGTLVGTRTWGGLVGISGYPPLMDGGSVTAASFGIMDTDGNWVVENEGVVPDVEVVQWPKAVIEGGDPQLEKAVEIALKQIQEQTLKPLPGYSPPSAR